MKIISVLVAAFQADKWLIESLNSIVNQQLPQGWELEVLIGVDGCKTTYHEAMAYKNDNVRVISLMKNYGTYITFNTLMEYAQGQYICRFDADDVMRSGYLLSQIKRLENNVDMTMTWSIYTDEDLQPTSFVMAHTHYHPKGGLRKRGSEGQFMIKRHVWDALGGFQPWVCGADTDFSKRVRYAGFNIEVLEDFLYYRRTHKNSLTCHPKTNFESSLRKEIEDKINQLTLAYQRLDIPIKITPIVGLVDQGSS